MRAVLLVTALAAALCLALTVVAQEVDGDPDAFFGSFLHNDTANIEAAVASVFNGATKEQWLPHSGYDLLGSTRSGVNTTTDSFLTSWYRVLSYCTSDAETPTVDSKCMLPFFFARMDLFSGWGSEVLARMVRRFPGLVYLDRLSLVAVESGWISEALILVTSEWDAVFTHALRLVYESAVDTAGLVPGEEGTSFEPDYFARFHMRSTTCGAHAAPLQQPLEHRDGGFNIAFLWPSTNKTTVPEESDMAMVGILNWPLTNIKGLAVDFVKAIYANHKGTLLTFVNMNVNRAGTPPVLPLTERSTAADVHRFIQRHSRSSFALRGARELRCALELQGVVAVLDSVEWQDGAEEMLRHAWGARTAVLTTRLKRVVPFFLWQPDDDAGKIGLLDTLAGDVTVLRTTTLAAAEMFDPLGPDLSFVDNTTQSRKSVTVLVPQSPGDATAALAAVRIVFPVPASLEGRDIARWADVVGGAIEDAVVAALAPLRLLLPLTVEGFHTLFPPRYRKAGDVYVVSALPSLGGDGGTTMDGNACAASVGRLNMGKLQHQQRASEPSAGVADVFRYTTSAELVDELDSSRSHSRGDGVAAGVCASKEAEALLPHCRVHCVSSGERRIYRLGEPVAAPSAGQVVVEPVEDSALLAAMIALRKALGKTNDGAVAVPVAQTPWSLSLPAGHTVPVLIAKRAIPRQTGSTSSTAVTALFISGNQCGLCANYQKAFNLVEHCHRHSATTPAAGGGGRDVVFRTTHSAHAIDAETGEMLRTREGLADGGEEVLRRARPPQLMLFNATHMVLTLPPTVAAQHTDWMMLTLQYLALVDSQLDVVGMHDCGREYLDGLVAQKRQYRAL